MTPSPPAVLVTGAGSGMGQAFAQRYFDAGWTVIAMDVNAAALEAIQSTLSDESRYLVAVADVRDRDAVRIAIDASGATAQLAAVVTAAGVFPPTNLSSYTDDLFHRIMDINVLGTLNVASEAIAVMREHGTRGAVVTISSADAFTASPEQLVYSASKAAVVSLTRVLAASVAADDILVNGIAPGWVNTPGNAATGRMVGAEEHIPLGRVAQPSELAEWAFTLGSRTTVSFVTGETIKVTGGELMS